MRCLLQEGNCKAADCPQHGWSNSRKDRIIDSLLSTAEEIAPAYIKALERIKELEDKINTPHISNFLEAVQLEALHQRERWGSEHDAGKSDPDWFWLLSYLAGKALHPGIDLDKKLHRIIATAAACLNWHANATGADRAMRPGIMPPQE